MMAGLNVMICSSGWRGQKLQPCTHVKAPLASLLNYNLALTNLALTNLV